MPNHVTCELTASPGILDCIAGEDTAIDFNKIIPMPDVITRDSVRSDAEDWARIAVGNMKLGEFFRPTRRSAVDAFRDGDFRGAAHSLHQVNVMRMLTEGPFPADFPDADFESFIQMIRSIRETGYANWHDWSVKFWGTKWNAYETKRIDEGTLRFETAWSAPLPVVAALSDRYPIEEIRLRWADEDFGNNVGDVLFKAGKAFGAEIEDGSREAYDLAIDLIHGGELPADIEAQ